MEESDKIQLLSNMGIAILTSNEIYNFSELLEQPLLKSLENSEFKWVYELLILFNQGDIATFNNVIDDACSRDVKILFIFRKDFWKIKRL
jgi:26S proteasome regulatory subunit N9